MSIYKKNQPKPLPAIQSPYKKRIIEIARLAKYEPIASIPSINNDFNYTYAKEGHLKRKQKIEPWESLNSSPKPEPKHSPSGHRLPKIDSKPNKIEYHPTNASQHEHLLTLDTRVQTEDLLANSNVRSQSPQKSPFNPDNRKGKAVKMKLKSKINQMQPESEDTDEDEYSTNATPGPGYYSVCESSSFLFDGHRRKNRLTDFSFGSKGGRFKEIKQPASVVRGKKSLENLERQHRKRQIVRRHKKIIPFLSCSFRDSQPLKQVVPGPQDYHPRYGIEQELIRKIQRNFKGNFGVCEKRFTSDDRYANLGPGTYALVEQPNFQNNSGSYYFKSEIQRFE